LHEYKGAAIYREKWSRRSVAKPNEAVNAPPLETIAATRKRVDDWASGLEQKIKEWETDVKKAKEKLKTAKRCRKKRIEGTEEEREKAKKKQKVCIIVLRLLSSDMAFLPRRNIRNAHGKRSMTRLSASRSASRSGTRSKRRRQRSRRRRRRHRRKVRVHFT